LFGTTLETYDSVKRKEVVTITHQIKNQFVYPMGKEGWMEKSKLKDV